MRALLLMGVLLTELTFGCSPHESFDRPAVEVGGGNTPTSAVEGGGGNTPASAPVRATWRLGAPVVFENLTVFPVIANESLDASKYITLDEGLRSGKVAITEIGANGRRRRIRPGQEASDDADVNRLLVTNMTGKTLILIAGEIVVGGKQDRIVGQDCLVASGPRAVPIDVFCVEPGRWHEDAAFGQSRNVEPDQVASTSTRARSARVRRGRGSGVGVGSGVGAVSETVTVTGGASALFVASAGIMAPSNIREQAQAAKDQSGVWDEVARTEKANNTSSATGNLNAVFKNKEVSVKLGDYDRAFAQKLSENSIVGVVVAVSGDLKSADVFATHSLFLHYWPKLLKAYSLEAASAGKSTAKSVDPSEAETYLSRATGKGTTGGRKGLYKLVENQTEEVASFELVNTSNAVAPMVHFNRVTKKK